MPQSKLQAPQFSTMFTLIAWFSIQMEDYS